MSATAESLELIQTVEPDIRSLMDTHRKRREHWYAHEVVPWEQGRSFRDEPWDESQATISRPVRTALVLNLLTEDNLPYYHARIAGIFPDDSAMAEWSKLWTAEEGQHAIAIRDFLLTSRNCDPRSLEDDRLATVTRGWRIGFTDPVDIFNYTSAQELATRVSHRNAGVHADDPIAYEVMNRVAVDENHHFMFYRGVTTAMLREAPSLVTIEGLLERGGRVVAHDPEAMAEAKRRFGDRIELVKDDYVALEGAGALAIHTEWNPYRRPDFARMKAAMAQPLVFDGRNLYDPQRMAELGFEYHSVGRASTGEV